MRSLVVLLICLLLSTPSLAANPAKQQIKELKRIQDVNARILAESRQEVEKLRREIQLLRGTLEEAQHFFDQTSQKDRKVVRDFDFRLTGIEEMLSLHQKSLEELLTKEPSKSKRKKKVDDEEGDYKRGLAEINLGNYQEAVSLFDEFLKKYPKSTLADNAQYWKGEALYASKDFTTALLEFQKVVSQFPESRKVSGAILKQGYCLYETKSYNDAQVFLKKVIQQFPNSDEAADAKLRLKKIEKILSQTMPANPPAP